MRGLIKWSILISVGLGSLLFLWISTPLLVLLGRSRCDLEDFLDAEDVHDIHENDDDIGVDIDD